MTHAGIPWAPAQGPHQAGRSAACLLGQRHLVEDLVGHRVVALPDVAAAGGHRREQADHLECIAGGRVQQGAQSADLGLEDPVEAVEGLLVQRCVGEHAGTVHQSGDGAEVVADAVEQRRQLCRVADVGGGVAHPGAGCGQCGQRGADLAVGQDALGLLFQLFRGDLEALRGGAAEQRAFEFGVGGQPVGLGRLRTEFGAADQHERRPGLLREGDHRSGGHAARAAGDHDHVLRADARGSGGDLLRVRDEGDAAVRATQAHFQFRSAGEDLVGDLLGDGGR